MESTVTPVEPTVLEPALPSSESPSSYTPAESMPTELSPSPRRFHYNLSFEARAVYDDNVTLAPIDPIDDFYGRVEATIAFGVGDIESTEENHFGVVYRPSYYFYRDNSDFNAFEHLARLDAAYRFSRLSLNAHGNIQSVMSSHLESTSVTGRGASTINTANIDAGGRQRVTTYSAGMTAGYDLTGKTTVSAGAEFSAADFESLINSHTFSGNLAVDYKLQPKVSLGVVGSAGKNFVDEPTPDQTFGQLRARMSYEVTGKVTANASAGVELRDFDSGIDDHLSPVFEIGVNYQPFDGTTVTLSAGQHIQNSAVLSNQDYTSTHFTGTLRQRLFQRVTVTLSGGVEHLSYFSTVDGSDTLRSDNYYFVEPGIDVNITRYWSVGVFYVHRMNDSTIALFGFDENQFGVTSRISF